MSSPCVAAAAILMRQAYQLVGVKSVTEATIYQEMVRTADKVYDSITKQSYLRLNLTNAIKDILSRGVSATATTSLTVSSSASKLLSTQTIVATSIGLEEGNYGAASVTAGTGPVNSYVGTLTAALGENYLSIIRNGVLLQNDRLVDQVASMLGEEGIMGSSMSGTIDRRAIEGTDLLTAMSGEHRLEGEWDEIAQLPNRRRFAEADQFFASDASADYAESQAL
jgi:hypothetical protein